MTFIVTFLVLSILNPMTSFADESVIDLPYKESEFEHSPKEKLIFLLHTRHSPGHLNDEEDLDIPTFLQFKPTRIPLPCSYKLPSDLEAINGLLDLRSLTPQALEELSLSDLKKLLAYLATIEVEMLYTDAEGHIQSGKKHRLRKSKHWEKSNAAAALALTMAVQSQYELFITMTALLPDAITPSIHNAMFGVLNPQIMAEIIGTMLLQLQGNEVGLANPMAKQIASLISRGLVFWVGKDIRLFNSYLTTLLEHAMPIIENNPGTAREQRVGILIGSVLAGIMMHVDTIKKTDEKRIWVIGLIANVAWAATSFIGCAPLAAPVVAGIAGGLSIGTVVSTAIMAALEFPRDYAPTLNEIIGSLEMGFLEASCNNNIEEKVNLLLMFKWIDASIHSNSLR